MIMLTKTKPMLALEAHEMLREMYRQKFDALEASVQPNENGKMFYTREQFKEYMKLRKMDQHVRLSEDILKNIGPLTPSKDITAIVTYWKTQDKINEAEMKNGTGNDNSKKNGIRL
jgi:hypothetical protein